MKKLAPGPRPRKPPRCVAVLFPFALAVGLGHGMASPAAPRVPSTAVATPSVVMVGFDPKSTGLRGDDVTDAVAAHVAEHGTDVVARAEPGQREPPADWVASPWNGVAARVWLSRIDDDTLRVEVWTPGDTAPWSRDLADEGDADLVLESVGVVVRGVLSTASSRREATPATEPGGDAEPVSKPKRRPPLGLTLAYHGETFAPERIWTSGARLGVGWEGRRGLLVDGGLSWFPAHGASQGVSVRRIPGQLGIGWRGRSTKRVRPGVLAIGVAEALGWTGANAGLEARPGWAVRIGAGAAADVTIDIGRGVFGFARVSAAGWVRGAQLVVERPEGSQRLIRASPVSVSAIAGLGYQLFFIRHRRADATPGMSG